MGKNNQLCIKEWYESTTKSFGVEAHIHNPLAKYTCTNSLKISAEYTYVLTFSPLSSWEWPPFISLKEDQRGYGDKPWLLNPRISNELSSIRRVDNNKSWFQGSHEDSLLSSSPKKGCRSLYRRWLRNWRRLLDSNMRQSSFPHCVQCQNAPNYSNNDCWCSTW